MAETDAFKKYLDAGIAFTQLTRARAEQVVKDLVKAGDLQRGQRKAAIDELVERSRRNAEALAGQVRGEVDSHLAGLGLARQSDVQRLEAEIAALRLLVAGAEAAPTAPVSTEPVVHKPPVAKPVKARRTTGATKATGAAKAAKSESAGVVAAESPAPASGSAPVKKAARKRA